LLKRSTETDERRLTGAVFLDLGKAFDTVWVQGPLYKLTVLNFPPYLVKTVSSYLRPPNVPIVLPDSHVQTVAPAAVVSPVLFSLHANDTPTPSIGVQLAQ
jgi:hypothetical protein